MTRAFFVSLCIAVLGQPRSQLGYSCPQIRIGGCHDDPHNFRSQRRLSPALAGLSLRVSPDALGRSGLEANDGGIPVNQTNFDFRNIKRGADWWPLFRIMALNMGKQGRISEAIAISRATARSPFRRPFRPRPAAWQAPASSAPRRPSPRW